MREKVIKAPTNNWNLRYQKIILSYKSNNLTLSNHCGPVKRTSIFIIHNLFYLEISNFKTIFQSICKFLIIENLKLWLGSCFDRQILTPCHYYIELHYL